MSRIYLAARYIRREELLRYKGDLQATGHTVHSRWLLGNHQWDGAGATIDEYESGRAIPPEAVRFAIEDWEDIVASEVVISFTETPRETFNLDDVMTSFEQAMAYRRGELQPDFWERLRLTLNASAGRSSRGGRHTEFGAALAMGKRCITVGPRENVFHLLPGVEVYADWADFVERVPRPFA